MVIDEAHRLVYQKYGAIFSWFDSSWSGWTATRKDEVDTTPTACSISRTGRPLHAYDLKKAAEEGFLVPALGCRSARSSSVRASATPTCPRRGEGTGHPWTGEDGPPDEVSDELEPLSVQRGHRRSGVRNVDGEWHKVADGDRLGKTIVSPRTSVTPEFIQQRLTSSTRTTPVTLRASLPTAPPTRRV